MARVIAIINDKGGVAKTTTTANLGTALWLLGKKVLLIDTDQQCNLTQIMGVEALEPQEDGRPMTLFEWLAEPQRIPVYERYDGLDFIPSSREMRNLDRAIGSASGRDTFLRRRLNQIRDDYDFILIDCVPGGKNLSNMNVLAAADEIIVPAEASAFSVNGTPNLKSFFDEVRENVKEDPRSLPVLGYLLVRFNGRTSLGKEVRDFYDTPSPALDGPLFPVAIRQCQKCNESPLQEMTLYEYAPDSTAAQDYMTLAQHITGITTTDTPRQWGEKAKAAFAKYKEE